MADLITTSFSCDDRGVTSITFSLIPRNEIAWGTCSLSVSADGKLMVCIHNSFHDPSVVFGQISLFAKALGVEVTSLTLSIKSVPAIEQNQLTGFLPGMIGEINDLINLMERYFIKAAQLHFELETKKCVIKNRHVCVMGTTGLFEIPFTLLVKMMLDPQAESIQSEPLNTLNH